ncbi:MAG: hypothetical protein IPF47_10125 [Gemmatimonadetes bacterium]|nr:hypothetical protein [Gemmatimonadota bacterium]
MPDDQYLRDGTDRWLVRRAMEGRLPDRLRTRTTYGAQGGDWTEWLPAFAAVDTSRVGAARTARYGATLPRPAATARAGGPMARDPGARALQGLQPPVDAWHDDGALYPLVRGDVRLT